MKSVFYAVTAALFLFGVAPSQATTIYVTFTGTVTSGDSDHQGLFGPTDGSLIGSAYTAYYIFDATFSPNVNYTNTSIEQGLTGGLFYGNTSPSLGATITINGHTQYLSGMYTGSLDGYNIGGSSGYSQQSYEVYGGTTAASYLKNLIYNFSGFSSGLPPSITAALEYDVQSGDTANGSYCVPDSSAGIAECLNFTPQHLSVALSGPPIVAPGETPLPAALPLFVSGLGGLGFLGWRRRRRTKCLTA